MNRRHLLMRNGQANADSSGSTSLKKHDEQFTSSTHFRWCTSRWRSRIWRLCKWNLPARGNPMRTHCKDQEDVKTSSSEWHLRSWASETEFLKMWHAANKKQWKETLVMRYSVKISDSKSLFETTKDKQEMPSIKLWENLQKITKLGWCQNFKVLNIDVKYEWKKMKEERHKWLGPMHETLHVVKEAHVAWTSSSSSSRRQRKGGRGKSDMHSGLQSHSVGLEDPGMNEKFYKSEFHKTGNIRRRNEESSCKLRSPWWRLQRIIPKKPQKVRCKLLSAQQLAISLENEMSQAPTVYDSWEIEAIRLTMEVAEQSTKTTGRNPLIAHLFIYHHQEWNVRNPLRRQKKLIPTVVIRRTQSVGNIFHRLLLLYRTRDRLLMKVLPKRKETEKLWIWALAASGKIQFLESLCPQRTDNKISSSSIDQRMVSRNCFGIICGRTGPFKIHMRQRGNETLKLGSQRLSKE